jgi:hypothetical protein
MPMPMPEVEVEVAVARERCTSSSAQSRFTLRPRAGGGVGGVVGDELEAAHQLVCPVRYSAAGVNS